MSDARLGEGTPHEDDKYTTPEEVNAALKSLVDEGRVEDEVETVPLSADILTHLLEQLRDMEGASPSTIAALEKAVEFERLIRGNKKIPDDSFQSMKKVLNRAMEQETPEMREVIREFLNDALDDVDEQDFYKTHAPTKAQQTPGTDRSALTAAYDGKTVHEFQKNGGHLTVSPHRDMVTEVSQIHEGVGMYAPHGGQIKTLQQKQRAERKADQKAEKEAFKTHAPTKAQQTPGTDRSALTAAHDGEKVREFFQQGGGLTVSPYRDFEVRQSQTDEHKHSSPRGRARQYGGRRPEGTKSQTSPTPDTPPAVPPTEAIPPEGAQGEEKDAVTKATEAVFGKPLPKDDAKTYLAELARRLNALEEGAEIGVPGKAVIPADRLLVKVKKLADEWNSLQLRMSERDSAEQEMFDRRMNGMQVPFEDETFLRSQIERVPAAQDGEESSVQKGGDKEGVNVSSLERKKYQEAQRALAEVTCDEEAGAAEYVRALREQLELAPDFTFTNHPQEAPYTKGTLVEMLGALAGKLDHQALSQAVSSGERKLSDVADSLLLGFLYDEVKTRIERLQNKASAPKADAGSNSDKEESPAPESSEAQAEVQVPASGTESNEKGGDTKESGEEGSQTDAEASQSSDEGTTKVPSGFAEHARREGVLRRARASAGMDPDAVGHDPVPAPAEPITEAGKGGDGEGVTEKTSEPKLPQSKELLDKSMENAERAYYDRLHPSNESIEYHKMRLIYLQHKRAKMEAREEYMKKLVAYEEACAKHRILGKLLHVASEERDALDFAKSMYDHCLDEVAQLRDERLKAFKDLRLQSGDRANKSPDERADRAQMKVASWYSALMEYENTKDMEDIAVAQQVPEGKENRVMKNVRALAKWYGSRSLTTKVLISAGLVGGGVFMWSAAATASVAGIGTAVATGGAAGMSAGVRKLAGAVGGGLVAAPIVAKGVGALNNRFVATAQKQRTDLKEDVRAGVMQDGEIKPSEYRERSFAINKNEQRKKTASKVGGAVIIGGAAIAAGASADALAQGVAGGLDGVSGAGGLPKGASPDSAPAPADAPEAPAGEPQVPDLEQESVAKPVASQPPVAQETGASAPPLDQEPASPESPPETATATRDEPQVNPEDATSDSGPRNNSPDSRVQVELDDLREAQEKLDAIDEEPKSVAEEPTEVGTGDGVVPGVEGVEDRPQAPEEPGQVTPAFNPETDIAYSGTYPEHATPLELIQGWLAEVESVPELEGLDEAQRAQVAKVLFDDLKQDPANATMFGITPGEWGAVPPRDTQYNLVIPHEDVTEAVRSAGVVAENTDKVEAVPGTDAGGVQENSAPKGAGTGSGAEVQKSEEMVSPTALDEEVVVGQTVSAETAIVDEPEVPKILDEDHVIQDTKSAPRNTSPSEPTPPPPVEEVERVDKSAAETVAPPKETSTPQVKSADLSVDTLAKGASVWRVAENYVNEHPVFGTLSDSQKLYATDAIKDYVVNHVAELKADGGPDALATLEKMGVPSGDASVIPEGGELKITIPEETMQKIAEAVLPKEVVGADIVETIPEGSNLTKIFTKFVEEHGVPEEKQAEAVQALVKQVADNPDDYKEVLIKGDVDKIRAGATLQVRVDPELAEKYEMKDLVSAPSAPYSPVEHSAEEVVKGVEKSSGATESTDAHVEVDPVVEKADAYLDNVEGVVHGLQELKVEAGADGAMQGDVEVVAPEFKAPVARLDAIPQNHSPEGPPAMSDTVPAEMAKYVAGLRDAGVFGPEWWKQHGAQLRSYLGPIGRVTAGDMCALENGPVYFENVEGQKVEFVGEAKESLARLSVALEKDPEIHDMLHDPANAKESLAHLLGRAMGGEAEVAPYEAVMKEILPLKGTLTSVEIPDNITLPEDGAVDIDLGLRELEATKDTDPWARDPKITFADMMQDTAEVPEILSTLLTELREAIAEVEDVPADHVKMKLPEGFDELPMGEAIHELLTMKRHYELALEENK